MSHHELRFDNEIAIPSDTAEAQRVQDRILEELCQCQFTEREIFGIKLAIEEALVNAIKHGNQLDKNKKVWIAYGIRDDVFCIRIRDEGKGFDPDDVPDPTFDENLERPCGRGLLLMRHYMNEVTFLHQGTCVCMWKRRNGCPTRDRR
jgi:serine/threonine-protein kinase RsbW